MNPLNIYFLSRLGDSTIFSQYEKALSTRKEIIDIKDYEQTSLRLLINNLEDFDLDIEAFDGFYFSYTIDHISKEFDLLKLSIDCSIILNIELKSEPVSTEKIKNQLIQNRYYLSHLSHDIHSYTYIASTNELYYLDNENNLTLCNLEKLAIKLKSFTKFFNNNISSLFRAADYLISPINTPHKFLNNDYFLTTQQNEIKRTIVNTVALTTNSIFISITGSPGTGKTLLLYDIAKHYSATHKVCIIHCGILAEGHNVLNSMLLNVDIIAIKTINDQSNLSKYSIILIDETQRIYSNQFDKIKEIVMNNKTCCIYSYDSRQVLSNAELKRDISTQIVNLSDYAFPLSDKIRTNRELASFIKAMLDLKRKINSFDYNCVDIIYAKTKMEACKFIEYFKNKKFIFINFTSSNYKATPFDTYDSSLNTHKVIGQEFDNVLMILNEYFYYDDSGLLCSCEHPNPDYLYIKLFFQGISRTRERLCIIIVNNITLFEKINSIKAHL